MQSYTAPQETQPKNDPQTVTAQSWAIPQSEREGETHTGDTDQKLAMPHKCTHPTTTLKIRPRPKRIKQTPHTEDPPEHDTTTTKRKNNTGTKLLVDEPHHGIAEG
ncbi:Hypothetical predicted protein [Pelobates cultripes]|uniref:Uncharacterized protein n=1 Tax=Pelobates cultripes TaxID=61616 RepID=A0AAD1W907_PELCU|nr:Hypothetical predicted protein [Pelobates cultripes]